MITMVVLSVAILVAGTLIAVRNGVVSPSSKLNSLVSDITGKIDKLETLAVTQEKKAAAHLARHTSASEVAIKARTIAANFGKLIDG
jgi:pantothenate kinase